MNSESSIEKTTAAESELPNRRLFLRSLGKWSGAAIVAAVGEGVWISFAPEADRRMGKPKGAVRGGGWINGGGGGWVNRRVGVGGGWINRW